MRGNPPKRPYKVGDHVISLPFEWLQGHVESISGTGVRIKLTPECAANHFTDSVYSQTDDRELQLVRDYYVARAERMLANNKYSIQDCDRQIKALQRRKVELQTERKELQADKREAKKIPLRKETS